MASQVTDQKRDAGVADHSGDRGRHGQVDHAHAGERRKEKRAAASRLIPVKSAPVIVVPERDEPGISEKTCATPMTRASRTPMCSISLRRLPNCSARNSRTAHAIMLTPITFRFFVKFP